MNFDGPLRINNSDPSETMNEDDLKTLIADIRRGRPEDETTDWKQKWYNLSEPKAQDEFVRDVAAMANALTQDNKRHILIGVSEKGALYDAPLPRDESALQEILDWITPTPNVSFERHEIEGSTVSLIVINAPFNRPYVAEVDNNHYVWIRRGSTTDTASRYILDRMYQQESPTPQFVTAWLRHEDEEDEPVKEKVLTCPGTSSSVKQFTEQKRGRFEQRKTLLCPVPEGLYEDARFDDTEVQEYEEELKTFEQQANDFFEALSDPSTFRYWYAVEKWESEATEVVLGVKNEGGQTASEVRFDIEFPEWLIVSQDESGPVELLEKKPKIPELSDFPKSPEPKEPAADHDIEDREGGDVSTIRPLDLEGLGVSPGLLDGINQPQRMSDIALEATKPIHERFEVGTLPSTGYESVAPLLSSYEPELAVDPDRFEVQEGYFVTGEVTKIRHKDVWVSPSFYVLATPGAPIGEHEIKGQIIAEEFDEWQDLILKVRIVNEDK